MTGIHDYEIPKLINELIEFLGASNVKSLASHVEKAKFNGTFERDFFLVTRHPWGKGFLEFQRILKKRKYSIAQLSDDIKRVGQDAAMYLPVLSDMPVEMKKSFRRRLCDPTRGRDAIFELTVAHRFRALGSRLEWIQAGGSRGAEFDSTLNGMSLRVECKTLEADTGHNYARKDFYRLADIILPKIIKMRLKGEIHIQLNQRLSSQHKELSSIVEGIVEKLKNGVYDSKIDVPCGAVSFKLSEISGLEIGQANFLKYVRSSIPEGATAATMCRTPDGADPVILSISTELPNEIIAAMLNKISDAKDQIGKEKLGAVYMYLLQYTPGELNELNELRPFGQIMDKFFAERAPSNLAAISFLSGPFQTRTFFGTRIQHEGLCYRNPRLAEHEIYTFPFIERADP